MTRRLGSASAFQESESIASHGTSDVPLAVVDVQESEKAGVLARVTRALAMVNQGIMVISAFALLAAACVLTLSVVTRYFLKVSTDWQDEASVFLIVGSIFMCGAYVQSYRGHVGIEALASILPSGVNRVRRIFVDIASFVFCAFFSWKSWAMFLEAYSGGYRTESTWAPPLWIPYGLLAVGMTNLSLQLLVQVAAHFAQKRQAP